MSECLEELFVQILNSEQKAQERRSVLNEVKQMVSKCLQEIEEAEEEQKSLQGQLVTEVQHWNDVELDLKCSSSREAILATSVEETRNKLKGQKSRLEELRTQRDSAHDDFCRHVEEFTLCFDLSNQSSRRWYGKVKETLDNLKSTRDNLREKLADFQRKLASCNSLQNDVESAKEQLKQKRSQLSEVQSTLSSECKSTRVLERQRQQISEMPNTSREFKRLRAELHRCKEETLEDYCSSLQHQLQELSRKRWQEDINSGTSITTCQPMKSMCNSAGGNSSLQSGGHKQPLHPSANNGKELKPQVETGRTNAQRFTNFGSTESGTVAHKTENQVRPNIGRLSAALKRNSDISMNNLGVSTRRGALQRK